MKIVRVQAPVRREYRLTTPHEPRLPTQEELEEVRRRLGPYSEAEHYRIVRGAFPALPPLPPESS